MIATFGVLKLTLDDGTYAWQFVPIAGKTFTDSGTDACHGARPTVNAGPDLTANHDTFFGDLPLGYVREDANELQKLAGLAEDGLPDCVDVPYRSIGTDDAVIGLKMKEDLARVGLPGWSLIGVVIEPVGVKVRATGS